MTRFVTDSSLDHLRSLVDLPDLSATKYVLVRRIARGGMGTVYLAEDRDLGRQVALKVLTVPDSSGHLVARMLVEARIVARLEHPAIVPIHDVGRLPDGRVYYTMKYVQGQTFTEYLAGNPPLPDRLRLVQQVCQAVAFAHSRNVVHRDLKPDNIMVGAFGEVLVMDWGVAKVLRERSHSNSSDDFPRADEGTEDTVETPTSDGYVIGSLAFMSPEQAEGKVESVDEQSDIYMAGATLYYALTGRAPFFGATPLELRKKIIEGGPPSPRQFNERIARPLAAICLKATARLKEERYSRAENMALDIGRFLTQEPVEAYPENPFQKAGRWISKNQFVVYLVVVYLIVRALIFFLLKR
jgi:eukaryotic-like serine/threonine-protein kinase